MLLDALFARDATGGTQAFLNIACDGARLQVARYPRRGARAPSAMVMLDVFLAVWSSWAGLPRGEVFSKEHLAHMFENGVEAGGAAQGARERPGRVERLDGA